MASGPSRQVSELGGEPCDSRVGCEAGAGRLERPKALASNCFRDRLLIRPDRSQAWHTGPSVGFAPTASSLPRTRSGSLSYKGRCLAGTTRTCDLRLRRAVLWVLLSYGEVASTAGVEPASSGFVDRRLDPFGHVDMSSTRRMGAVDGICTRDLRLDRPVLPLAELRRHGAPPGPRTQSCPG